MNRYPLWKYIVVAIALVIGVLYTLPNFFGETPAVQVSPIRATLKSDDKLLQQVTAALDKNGISSAGAFLDTNGVKVRLPDTDTQLKARDVLEHAFNPKADGAQYVVALNLLSASPKWLTSIHALPMYLGLDLRGGVHFLLQVDLQGALTKRIDATGADIRTLLRDKNIRHAGISREDQRVVIRFREADYRGQARAALLDSQPDLTFTEQTLGNDPALVGTFKPEAIKRIQEFAVKQNITTLHNRINELGVAEPIIQQSGPDRIVVQLPGVQDTAKAKDILGRTATLEIRMVDDTPGALESALNGNVPATAELYTERGGNPILVKKVVVLTGERLNDAQPGFDNQTQEPAVHLTLDSAGSRIFRDITRENVGKRMAILLIEKGKGEVITAPVIRSEIGGGKVQISGRMTTVEANETALLLRAGSHQMTWNIDNTGLRAPTPVPVRKAKKAVPKGGYRVFDQKKAAPLVKDAAAKNAPKLPVPADASDEVKKLIDNLNRHFQNMQMRIEYLRAVTPEGNPSAGNKFRGLYNITLKSLGAVHKKDPRTRIDHVIDYADPLGAPGFYFMDSPGNDLEGIAGQVGAGCNLFLFVTGNGSITTARCTASGAGTP